MKKQTYISSNNVIIKYLFLGIMLVVTSSINGQKVPVSFPSPEAASLGSVGNIPVDYHTGAINIAIPLFNMNIKGYDMPISLQYNSSGFRSAIRPTWVGQNWTLKAGGVIVRSINGMPDEKEEFGFRNSEAYRRLQGSDWATKVNPGLAASTISKTPSDYDTEPDEFTFNVNGVSGKFYFDIDGTIKVLSDPSIKVEYENSYFYIRDFFTFKGFKITLNDGAVCYFGYNPDLIETTTTQDLDFKSPPVSNATSWYLYKIEIPQSDENIVFKYSSKYIDQDCVNVESGVFISAPGNSCYSRNSGYTIITDHIYLQSIETNDSRLVFSTSNQAIWADNNKWQKLDSMSLISNFSNKVLKNVAFNYTGSRFFLESVKESGKPPYEFNYEGGQDTGYEFCRLDHWGYYNGFNSSSMICSTLKVDGDSSVYHEINRETDPSKITIGSLRQIKYPTGGVVCFEFEANDYSRYCFFEQGIQVDPCYVQGVVKTAMVKRGWSDWMKDLDFVNGELVVQDPIYIRLFYTPLDTMDIKYIGKRLEPGRYDTKYFEMKYDVEKYYYNIEYRKLHITENAYCGGLRIKKMIQKEEGNETIHEYKYISNYAVNSKNTRSSGVLGSLPNYDYSLLADEVITRVFLLKVKLRYV